MLNLNTIHIGRNSTQKAGIPTTTTTKQFTLTTLADTNTPQDLFLNADEDIMLEVDWGDGTTTQGANNAHVYAVAGLYNVVVRATNVNLIHTIKSERGGWNFDIKALPKGVTEVDFRNNDEVITGNVKDFPRSLKAIEFFGKNTIGGDGKDLPSNLEKLELRGDTSIGGLFNEYPQTLQYVDVRGDNLIDGTTLGSPSNLELLRLQGDTMLSGDVAHLSRNITFIRVEGENILTGDLSDLPSLLTHLRIRGNSELVGNVLGLPRDLVDIFLGASCQSTGSPADLPPQLQSLELEGNNALNGNFSQFPNTLKDITLRDESNIKYDTLHNNNFDTFTYLTDNPWSAASIDQFLIDVAASGNTGGKIDLTGGNAPRTSASDSALTTLLNAGWQVDTN